MMRQSRELAQVNEAKGYRWGDELILRISGDKPSPCYQVDIEEMPMTIFPPEFAATQAPDPLAFCTEVITPYERVQVFRVGGGEFDTVTLHAAGGDIEVPIERIEAGDLARGVDPPRRRRPSATRTAGTWVRRSGTRSASSRTAGRASRTG